jgi:hypothetical protein
MFKSSELGSELQALKRELSSLMGASADNILCAAHIKPREFRSAATANGAVNVLQVMITRALRSD